MLWRVTRLLLTAGGIGVGCAIVVLALEPQGAPGHNPGHVGCKHGHGSTWLRAHSRRGRGDDGDDEDEVGARNKLRPFATFGR